MKKCGRCQKEKEDIEFSAGQLIRSGGICRPCNTEIARIYRANNSDKVKKYNKEYGKKYYEENKEEILQNKKEYYEKEENKVYKSEWQKNYYQENKEEKQTYNKKYYEENRGELIQYALEYQINNADRVRENHNRRNKERRIEDLNFKLKTSISANISFYLKSNGFSKNNKSTLKYLSYTIDELREHLEKLFEPWMSWDNYGKYDTKKWNDNDSSTWTWQIDHIIPHSTFKYTSMEDEEFKKCWALENLRPYSSKQNFIDGVIRIRH